MEFLTENRRPGPYKKGGNFILSQNVLRKYFLAKLFVPLTQRSVPKKILGSFWTIEFLTENRHSGTLQKWWKF